MVLDYLIKVFLISEEGYVTHGMGGTSGATPATGVCGLVLSTNPDLSAKEVRKIILIG